MGKLGKALGSISPLAGAVTGEGLFGGLKPIAPLITGWAALAKNKKKKPEVAAVEEDAEGMRKGGKVKYRKGGSVRGDGCAKRGKTKGRVV